MARFGSECDVVALREPAASAGTPGGSRPSVALTFDDGYADQDGHAHPLLEGRRLRARFFVTVGLLERDRALRELRGVARGDLEPPTWNRSERSDAPGSTSPRIKWRYPSLVRLEADEARDELERPNQTLDQLGEPVTALGAIRN